MQQSSSSTPSRKMGAAAGCRPTPPRRRVSPIAGALLFGISYILASSQQSAAYYCPGITCYADGSCLPLSKRCDGVRDCIDGRDEDDCEVACDFDSEFDCGDGKCINSLQRCDGNSDCTSGSDEDHCDVIRHCRPNDFVCDRRRCIPSRSRCNGARDCIDGTDEINCKSISCQSTSFACASGDQCIQEWQECDGRRDCRDGSDESSCAKLIKISVSPPAAIAQAGESVRFRCSVKCPGRMQCSVKWSLAGNEPLPREARQHGNVLTLSPVAPWSSADYTCAVAEAPSRSASARLLVRPSTQPAALRQAPADQRGRECELACPAGHFYSPRASERCVLCVCSSRQYCDPCSGSCVDCTMAVSAASRQHCDRLLTRHPASSAANITCDVRGTMDGRSSPRGGFCYCKTNVVGQLCDQCKGGTFFLSKDNPDGCIACECSGVSTDCLSSSLQRTKLATVFGPTAGEVEFVAQESLPAGYQVVTVDKARGQLQADLAYMPRNHAYYWKLPQKYLGNRLVAYGGFLQFSVEYVPLWDTLTSKSARIIMNSGSEQRLFAKLWDNVDVSTRGNSRLHSVKIQMTEHSWRFANGAIVSRRQFLLALANITELLIEAAVASDGALSVSKLGSVSMDVAGGREHVSAGSVGDRNAELQLDSIARQVEQCKCPSGYGGLSCEVCQVGYYRRPSAPWGACVKCHCNGHSDRCDPLTGVCLDCRQGTEGRQCERCSDGWTGDARRGACLPSPRRQQSNAAAASPATAPNNVGGGGVRVLEDRVMVAAGDAAVLTCEHAGRGVSLTWTRLDGGALPPTARQESGRLIIPRTEAADAGRYVCIARTSVGGDSLADVVSIWADLVVEATPNCPPCSRHGSRAATSGPASAGVSCTCRCKRFVEGKQCDRCIEGYFDLHQDNEDGCRPCYCSGRSQNCSSANYFRYQKRISTFDSGSRVEVVQRNGVDGGVRPISADRGAWWVAGGLDVLERRIARPLRLFWSLPTPFLGYQGDAYGGHLEYSVEYLAGPQRVRDIDVELVSHGTRVHHLLADIPSPGVRTLVRVPMTEHAWRTTSGGPLSRADFMHLLSNVTTLLIRLSYARSTTESRLHEPRLSGARPRGREGGSGGEAREVELCLCPPEYAGASCQDCAEGYRRSSDGTCFREKAQPTFQTARTRPTPVATTSATVSYSTTARAQAPPVAVISATMKDSVIAVGMSGSLVCPSSWPEASYTWTREGGFPLPPGVVVQGRELLVLNATMQLDGWYTCRATSRYGSHIATARINIVPQLWSPRRITAPSGSEVIAECLATGQPTGNLLYWQSPRGQKVTVSTPIRSLLKFGHVTMGHAGNYTCLELSGSTIVSSAATEIIVKPAGEIAGAEARRQRRHSLSNNHVNSNVGTDVTLRCQGSAGTESQEVTWLRADSFPLPAHSRSEDGLLHIDDVRDVDAGVYKCMSRQSSESKWQHVAAVHLVVTDGGSSQRGRR